MDTLPALSGLAILFASVSSAAALYRVDAPATETGFEWWQASGAPAESADVSEEEPVAPPA